MNRGGKVVPFERPAAYWAVRARRHRAPDRQPDKARLLRKALEKSGDPGIALELSALYADMDCYTAAERYLLRAAVTGGLTGDVCFGIGCCALNRGQEALGEGALDLCLRLDPDGRYAERAQDILETYPWTYEAPLPGTARSDTLCRRAREALAVGDRSEALALAQGAWKRGRTWDAAGLLGALLPPKQAIPYLRQGLRLGGGPEGRFALADAFARLGRRSDARRELKRALPLCDTLGRCEGFCLTAWQAGCGDLALKLTDERLQKMPRSTEYMLLRCLCLRRLGRGEQAGRVLETILEIDPDDASALWYRRHPEEKNLDADSGVILAALGAMVAALPGRLRPGPLNRLLHLMTMMLAGQADAGLIYREAPRLWRRLSEAEKRALDQRRSPSLTGAFAVYLLLAAGRGEQAARLLGSAPGKRRILRLVRRMIRWIEEEDEHALHQF